MALYSPPWSGLSHIAIPRHVSESQGASCSFGGIASSSNAKDLSITPQRIRHSCSCHAQSTRGKNRAQGLSPNFLPDSGCHVASTCGRGRNAHSSRVHVYDPSVKIDFPMEDEELEIGEDVTPAPPPTPGRLEIEIDNAVIKAVDLGPAHAVLRKYVAQIGDNASTSSADPMDLLEQRVGFTINYVREDPLDPRELSEMPDIRIWFARLDAAYPWLPAVLDWRGGELARYSAMLVPHQMSRRLGLVFNPEALELWAISKFFVVYEWMRARALPRPELRVKDMMRVLGFTIDDALYTLVDRSPPPQL
eukprot:TRINITY_DN17032_c0_g1_i1.p1 TRINITY_DN17032_c0_g1~~TRINITY_DN17032_c0_g1_i1.p1  ORF type:complete len:306 (+),score=29.85 TRINITY_DN17032_c0_g1_i1:128-1045(+)